VRRLPRREIRPEDLAGLRFAQYIRDSTEDQAEGFGPDAQRRANLSFAQRYGLVNSGLEYEEFLTATTVHRRNQMLQAVTDLKSGLYKVLLVGWTHRFTRSLEDAGWLKRQIWEAQGVLVYTAQGFIAGQRSTRLQENILHAIDQEYSENLGDLVAAGLLAKFEAEGANGVPPLGSKHVYIRRDGTISEGPERHTLAVRVLNPEHLPALRALLSRYIEFGSYRKTADWLNAHGYRTREGGLFAASSVAMVVQNPFYGSEEIVRYHAGQVDEQQRAMPRERQIFPDDIHELWLQAQPNRAARAAHCVPERASRIYPLHGVLRCVRCGSVYHGQTKEVKRRSFHVRPMEEDCGRPRMMRSDLLEDQLTEVLEELTLPSNWRSQIQSLLQRPDVDQARELRARLEKKVERLRYQHLCEAVDDETFRREVRELREQLQRLPQPGPPLLDAYREPVELLQSVGKIVGHPIVRRREDAMRWFKRFCELTFVRINVEGSRLVSLYPQARYRELFAVSLASQGGEHVRSRGLQGTRPNRLPSRPAVVPSWWSA